jgi:predicted metalloprotease
VKWDKNADLDMSNVDDVRGQSGGGMGGGFQMPSGGGFRLPKSGGMLGILLMVAAVFILPKLVGGGGGFNIDASGLPGSVPSASDSAIEDAPQNAPLDNGETPDDEQARFAVWVFNDAQTVWEKEFAAANKPYEDARMRLYTEATQTGCGMGSAQMGPFYCPADKTVYLDLNFYTQLSRDFGAPGDFAQAYVIAHEVGHHVQQELGISDQVTRLQRQNPSDANALSMRLELQADCLAGVWAHSVYTEDSAERGLSDGDIEEGMVAAEAVGDDTIQERTTGRVDPHSWNHGSAEQRTKWFRVGLDSGNSDKCDTFSVKDI